MERFWGTLESARRGGFSEELIADIVRFYNTTWTHGALKRTPRAARTAGINWRAPNAVIDATISNNLIWGARPQ
jgi:transposase InsO family protein